MTPHPREDKKVKKEVSYKKRDVCTIVEVEYSDGETLYELEGKDENGTWSGGMYNQIDLMIQILVAMGKISQPKVFIFKDHA